MSDSFKNASQKFGTDDFAVGLLGRPYRDNYPSALWLRLCCWRSLCVVAFPVSRLGGKEIGDGCGIDAWNLSPRKRRDAIAAVTVIPFAPSILAENPDRARIPSSS